MTDEERSAFGSLLSSIFYAYDRDSTSQVDVLEFSSGFSLLCHGSKSTKLSYAFDLLDEDEDQKLSRRGLWRYLRSFLTVLMGASLANSGLSGEELVWAIDSGAVHAAAVIYQETEREEKNKISFEELAAWYTNGGYWFAPWLELLDLKKWLVAE
eukprot:CAMPEP_0113938760 /NCGR_PEP_ID=MMETSP1339-20121228/5188_1 /TAXON_ID=94617 /ORGANISM="Fibrocapsa japonica" /LENGTH=154 /DNA_ID=CAMNT_0000942029 /DNA_START=42 /DNA_END=506 /DNA_ORIENTATION=+ /assembly_acc=CAM_ASM_000762